MNIIIPILIWLIVVIVVIAFLFVCNKKCKHDWCSPKRIGDASDWYYHEYTLPQLKGDKIKCYRKDVIFERECKICREIERFAGYDQKIHESDTMHRTPENFVPDPMPDPVISMEAWKNSNK